MFACLSGHCISSVQIRSFFWSVFSRIRNEYGEILRISPYSVRIRVNTEQKKLRISFGHFSSRGGFCYDNNTKLHYWVPSGFHFLIFPLNSTRDSIAFISEGINSCTAQIRIHYRHG